MRVQRAKRYNESGSSREFGEFHNLAIPGYLSSLPLLETIVNVDEDARSPNLAYRITVNESDQQYYLSSVGSRQTQVAVYIFLAVDPLLTGFVSIWIYMYAFYAVKVNMICQARKESNLPTTIRSKLRLDHLFPEISLEAFKNKDSKSFTSVGRSSTKLSDPLSTPRRRTILIATMEYEIDDPD
ncbi:Cell wall alpha-1,3-glucan synthase ags1 [Sticta canariensis]|nr:Cell wall alpha-1,3-glucan synthase ags1 [Sticta canariensis]